MNRLATFGSIAAASWLALAEPASAATFAFATDPFTGSTALGTPGRQIVGSEPTISFDIANDVFAFERSVFDLSGGVSFANGPVSGFPTSGLNVAIVGDLDNDGNPATPFGVGIAANLLADRITSPGAGLFIYFNSGLDTPRLVYSTDLSDNQADLKILARLTNLAGNPGALANFTASNFAFFNAVPEPASWAMMISGFGLVGAASRRRQRANNQLRLGSQHKRR